MGSLTSLNVPKCAQQTDKLCQRAPCNFPVLPVLPLLPRQRGTTSVWLAQFPRTRVEFLTLCKGPSSVDIIRIKRVMSQSRIVD